MQLSNALSQEFLLLSQGKRNVIVDTTLCGMGRGAGNTPTELLVQYMISHMGYAYNIDVILDTIDNYIDNIRTRCKWGYTIPFFIAGANTSHVNNINYLLKKNGIRSKDLQYILNSITVDERKRYDYQSLEEKYFAYLSSDIDDTKSILRLKELLKNRTVLIMAPGRTIKKYEEQIKKYLGEKSPVVISVNYVDEIFLSDFVFMSNTKRHDFWKNNLKYKNSRRIFTSNITMENSEKDIIVSYINLLKTGWNNMDNSTILLLRLLDQCEIEEIGIAGFDGYSVKESNNFVNEDLASLYNKERPIELNNEISSMCEDYVSSRKKKTIISMVTPSRFCEHLKGVNYE